METRACRRYIHKKRTCEQSNLSKQSSSTGAALCSLFPSAATMLRILSRRLATVGREQYCSSPKPVKFSSSAAPPLGGGRLQGKVALVTGGASGLGKATAREFLREGAAAVVLADVDARSGREAAQELGPQADFVECDVTDEPQVAAAVDFAVTRHGRLHVMHNSAGIAGPLASPDVSALDLAAFDAVMAANVRGTLAGVKHAARAMATSGSGSIICMSSVSGIMGGLGTHPYTISKLAVAGIVRSMAGELSRRGVRLNCISPFAIPTPMVLEQFSQIYGGAGTERLQAIVEGLGELAGGKCEEIDVAKAAVYLASDESKFVSGHNLVVDGGFTSYKQFNMPMPDRI